MISSRIRQAKAEPSETILILLLLNINRTLFGKFEIVLEINKNGSIATVSDPLTLYFLILCILCDVLYDLANTRLESKSLSILE